ncbi:hypothetical protein D3C86_1597200 [compost metagenome]
MAVDRPLARDDAVPVAGLGAALDQALRVRLAVDERERIHRAQLGVGLAERTGIEQLQDALTPADPEVVTALGADVEVGAQILGEQGLRAGIALGPEAVGHLALLAFGVDQLALAARGEPVP